MTDIKVNLGRRISLENAQIIGQGFYSDVYRIDPETVVKVLKTGSAEAAEREILLSKWALTSGIPTAISYDVVDIDGCPGLVYELLGKGSLRDRLLNHPEEFDMRMRQYTQLLHSIHSVTDSEERLPNAIDYYRKKLDALPCIAEDERGRMRALLDTIPDTANVVHRDCHIKNIKVADDELMLIDLETLSRGDPIFDFTGVYCTYKAFGEAQNLTEFDSFMNLPIALEDKIFSTLCRLYFNGLSETELAENIGKIAMLGYLHMLIFICDCAENNEYDLLLMLKKFRESLAKTENLRLKY